MIVNARLVDDKALHFGSSPPEAAAEGVENKDAVLARGCHQLSQTTAAARWMAARKFRAVLS